MSVNDPHVLWETLRSGLSQRLPERTFLDWIEPCRPLSCEGSTLWIQTPSASARVWIEQQLAEEFHDVMVQSGLSGLRLAFTVSGEAGPGKAAPPWKPTIAIPWVFPAKMPKLGSGTA